MRISDSSNSRVLLVDKAIEVKIHFVSEPYVASVGFTVILKLQHGVYEIIACVNGISTEGLMVLDFVRAHV